MTVQMAGHIPLLHWEPKALASLKKGQQGPPRPERPERPEPQESIHREPSLFQESLSPGCQALEKYSIIRA